VQLIFVNRYFHPDHSATSQMLSGIAFALAAEGHDVHVVTSRQRYDAPGDVLPASEMADGVAITRVWTSRFGRNNLLGRAFDYLTFYLAATLALWRLSRRGDVIVAKTDPPMMSVLAAPVARWRRAHLVNWLQDVFPEVAEGLGMSRGLLVRMAFAAMRRLRDRSLRAAAANVVLGERMAERLAALGMDGARTHIIPNWADGVLVRPVESAVNALRNDWGLAGKFVVGYSGNLGRAHDVATMLDAIAITERSSLSDRIVWLFIGGGAQLATMQQEAKSRGLSSVAFRPYQPAERLAESLSAADVHLISLRPELEGLIVPSKFYGIAAAGRATIFIGDADGEIARALRRDNAGLCVAQGNGMSLAEAVLALATEPHRCWSMGENARAAFDRDYDKALAIEKWRLLIDRIARPAQAVQHQPRA
jgi:glycosyltransferase involved in cell wall biosynthesis